MVHSAAWVGKADCCRCPPRSPSLVGREVGFRPFQVDGVRSGESRSVMPDPDGGTACDDVPGVNRIKIFIILLVVLLVNFKSEVIWL